MFCCSEPLGPLNRIFFEFITTPLGQNSPRQENMDRKKNIFLNLLTMASMRWIKQKATDTEQKNRKDLWKTNDTDWEEQDTGKVALLCWELLLYKP